ncbi:MAG: hypothetical protein R3E79_02740 [Caldilineaceae bacterium]
MPTKGNTPNGVPKEVSHRPLTGIFYADFGDGLVAFGQRDFVIVP